MRLKSMSIKNFKGIGEQGVTISFAPITMLFGPNNAGKSTIIQALHLAREVFCEHEPSLNRMEKYGNAFNMGTFKDYVHGHDLSKIISIKLDFESVILPNTEFGTYNNVNDTAKPGIDDIIADVDNFSIDLSLQWSFAYNKVFLSNYRIYLNNRLFTSLECTLRNNGNDAYIVNDTCHPEAFITPESWEQISALQNKDLNSQDSTFNEDLRELVFNSIPPILHQFVNMDNFIKSLNDKHEEDNGYFSIAFNLKNKLFPEWGKYIEFEYISIYEGRILEEFYDNFKFQCNEIFSCFFSMTGKVIGDFLNKLLYIGPIREIPPRGSVASQRITHSRWADGLAPWDMLLTATTQQKEQINTSLQTLGLDYSFLLIPKFDFHDFQKQTFIAINHFKDFDTKIHESLQKFIEILLSKMFKGNEGITFSDILPKKTNFIEELTNNTNSNAVMSFFEAKFTDDIDIKKSFDKFIRVLKEENQVEKFVNRLRAFVPPINEYQILLENNQTKVTTEPHDMGVGISQIIPFIIAMVMASKNSFIAIEQPELHIHPKLQVNLGDIVINSALQSENTPIFLIETHSEHLLLRLLRRIRQTNDGVGQPHLQLKPKDLAVNWIGPINENDTDITTQAMKLKINNEGNFTTPWPEGFFGERGKELFE